MDFFIGSISFYNESKKDIQEDIQIYTGNVLEKGAFPFFLLTEMIWRASYWV